MKDVCSILTILTCRFSSIVSVTGPLMKLCPAKAIVSSKLSVAWYQPSGTSESQRYTKSSCVNSELEQELWA
jgi:hypothetical protein